MQLDSFQTEAAGELMHRWATDLFPVCRSLTGDGVRHTFSYLQKLLPDLKTAEVPSGTTAFDWTIPNEWNISDAYIADTAGKRIVDFRKNNLHVVGYSEPVDQKMSFVELDQHLHSLPDQPNAIPYLTSYYSRRWGFCLTHEQRLDLAKKPKETYRVVIQSTLQPGHLTYGEIVIPGEEPSEILLSTYICHPSMGNNELSGPCVATAIALWLKSTPHRFSYRILFLPETIGSIYYLSVHLAALKKRTFAGFVLSCLGDDRTYSYLASRRGNTISDRAAKHALQHLAPDYKAYSFLDRGSDERQYCSPGVDLPVCSIMRSKYAEYPEYHTSLDDLSLISPSGLQGGFNAVRAAISALEANRTYRTKLPCEPQLGKRGLYPSLSTKETTAQVADMMNLLAYSDGETDLLSIAETISVPIGRLSAIAEKLREANVVELIR